MDLSLGIWDYVVIVLTLILSAAVGMYFRFTGGKQKTTEEFLMAGKDMSPVTVAFSMMATYMSGILVLGIPAEVYMYGAHLIMWTIMLPFSMVIVAYILLPVFFDMKVATAYEYLEKRFGKTTRSVASISFIIQMILYMAVVLYAPSLALNAVTGLSIWASVLTLSLVCIFYCSIGGLKAVLWTDVIQSLLMYFAVIAIVVKGTIDYGGFQKTMDIAKKGGRLVFFNLDPSITTRFTLWNLLAAGIFYTVSAYGANQVQVQRMMSLRTIKRSRLALYLSAPLTFIFNIFCVWDGLILYSNHHDCDPMLRPEGALSSPDQLIPHSIVTLFKDYPGLSGLCIAGVFGASLSTISSAINSLTAVTIEDFIRPYCFCKRLSETWMAFIAKLLVLVYGAIFLLLTFIVANFRGILEASTILFGLFGGPLFGVFLLGMFTIRANEKGSLLGLFIGFILNIWMAFGSWLVKVQIPSLPRSIDGCPSQNETYSFFYNETHSFFLNETHSFSLNETHSFFLNETTRAMLPTEEPEILDDSDVFPLYKVSFLWFSIFAALAVIVVGYISSIVINCFSKSEPKMVPPELITPPLRKWFFGSKEIAEKAHKKLQDQSADGEVIKLKEAAVWSPSIQ